MSTRLLVALIAAAAAVPAAAQERTSRGGRPVHPPGYFAYGPSWLGPVGSLEPIYAFGPKRPAKLADHVVTSELRKTGAPLAFAVGVWGDVTDPKPGNRYELRYQLKVHTKKGESGPLLGIPARPGGIGPVVVAATAGGGWNGMEGEFDVTRKELSGMTGWPELKAGRQTVFLRVEPQLFDATAQKYLTPSKTDATILVAEVGPGRKVESLGALPAWVVENGVRDPDAVLTTLADLDGYRPESSRVGLAVAVVLADKKTTDAARLKFLAWLPPRVCNADVSPKLYDVLNDYANGPDAALKAAAKDKLNAMFAAHLEDMQERLKTGLSAKP